MRVALQTAAANEKALSATATEVTHLKARLADSQEAESRAVDLAAKITALEAELAAVRAQSVSLMRRWAKDVQLQQNTLTHGQNGFPTPSTPTHREPRTRLSTGSAADDPDKKLRGFQHIIQELSAENAELKEKYQSVLEEVGLLKEVLISLGSWFRVLTFAKEVKLLEEANDLPNGGERTNGTSPVNFT